MAAVVLAAAGHRVDLHDAMASPGRKFLLAGIGGLNLTHAEPHERFVARYGTRRARMEPLLDAFGADALRDRAWQRGIATFVKAAATR
jgi:predicted flavoprotein YhiN